MIQIYLKYNFIKDLTYLFEKVHTTKFIKLTDKKFNYIKIQENIFYKYISIINKQYIYNTIIHKYNSPINLHNYLINFPIFISNINIKNEICTYELKTQLSYIKNNIKNYSNLQFLKTLKIDTIKSIESIFELYLSKIKTTTIIPTTSFILHFTLQKKDLYYLEIPIQNLLHNLNITILQTTSEYYLIPFKLNNTLVIGGDLMNLNEFSPNLTILYYYNNLIHTTKLYTALQNTIIYSYNLILESLIKQYRYQGILLPAFLFELIVKRMVSYVKIVKSGNTLLMFQDVVPKTLINLINQSFILNGLIGAFYIPVIIGISKLSISCSGLLSSLSFQETLKLLSKFVLDNKIDWILDLKSKIIISDLLNTGTGWYKHYNIKNKITIKK